ncbi:Spy/CpxP family protein refolding chaperone [Sulfurimonas sp. HSL3-7]|uniref:Spy/CpxP family protein refolding chaperone n=1 Tax=Sulfonitrofixus jiaomeiensis TaxID=3131938 RepID=UPI0031F95CF4
MKRTLLIGLLLTSVSAFAYMGHPGPDRMMLDELNLTPAQEKEIKTIRKESRNERIKLMDQMDELRDETRKQMMSVLNDEQKRQFIALRKEMRQSRRDNGCDRGTMGKMKPPMR